MTFTTLITARELQVLQASSAPVLVFDCSADVSKPDAGHQQFLQAHIPGARHADLNKDLSAHSVTDAASGGRHPLPSRERFALWLRNAGLMQATQVVVYDRQNMNFCGRLWWMLKWAGHDAVAVLDGGLSAWQEAGGTLASSPAHAAVPSDWALQPPLRALVQADEVMANLVNGRQTVVDARAEPRYRGEVEPLDPVAGHIPGALNRPFGRNLDERGHFKPKERLRQEFEELLAGRDPTRVVHQCGSGVSALPNLLAMEIAGYAPTRLFAGSWSEWCSDPTRPIEKG